MQYLQLLRDQHLKFMYFFSISSASHAKNCMKRDKGSGCGKKAQNEQTCFVYSIHFHMPRVTQQQQQRWETFAVQSRSCTKSYPKHEARSSLSSAIDWAVIERTEPRNRPITTKRFVSETNKKPSLQTVPTTSSKRTLVRWRRRWKRICCEDTVQKNCNNSSRK